MLQRKENTISCPDCGRSWHFMDGLNAGDACPSDDCPSNDKTPLGIVNTVCRDFDGNGIYSVGAIGALMAMMRHWKDHLAEGCSPKIISQDIDEMASQLEVMRAEIARRILDATRLNRRPFRIMADKLLVNGNLSFDVSVAESLFDVDRRKAEDATNDRFEQYLQQSESIFGKIDARKYEALVESFIQVVIQPCCTAV
jgi:hypothetical protein